MKRSPMARSTTPMARGSGMAAKKPAGEVKPARGPKPKKCAVRSCRKEFHPARPFIKHCSDDCGVALGMEALAKRKAAKEKAERAEDRRKKAEGMGMRERMEVAQKLVNRVAVLRDWHDGCISCDKSSYWAGTWHGSHYKSVGSNSALRFNLWNISKSCSECNWHKSGNIANYVPRLKAKFGAERLEWLGNHPRSREYSAEYLARLCTVMRKKIIRMERRLGLRK